MSGKGSYFSITMPVTSRIRIKYSNFSLIVLFFVLFICYVATIPPGIYWKDAGEFCIAARFLGITHPPGSPLYVCPGRLFCLLPFSEIATRVSLLSACFGILCIIIVYISVRYAILQMKGDADRSSLLIMPAVLGIGIGVSFWHYASVPEIYTTAFFLFLLGFYLYERWFFERDIRYIAAASLALSLACTIYLPLCIYLPAFFLSCISAESLRRLPRLFVISMVSFLLGLTIFLYLPIRAKAEPVLNWGNPDTLQRFITHITAGQYHESKLTVPLMFFPFRLWQLAGMICVEFPIMVFFTGLVGFITARTFRRAWKWWMVPLLISLINILFSLRYGEWLPHFFIPSYLMLGILFITATGMLRFKRTLLIGLLVANTLVLLCTGIPIAGARKSDIPETLSAQMLASLPQGAILVLENGNTVNICLYQQWCKEMRQDILILDPYGTYYSQARYKGFKALDPFWLAWQKQDTPAFRSALLVYINNSFSAQLFFTDSVFAIRTKIYEKYHLQPIAPDIWQIVQRDVPLDEERYDKHYVQLRQLLIQAAEDRGPRSKPLYNQNREALAAIVNNSAEIYYQQGYNDKAISLWEEIVERDIRCPEAAMNLVKAYDERDSSEDAERMLSLLLKRFPDREDVHHTAGIFYIRDNRHDAARREFEIVLRFNPNRAEVARALEKLRKIPLESDTRNDL